MWPFKNKENKQYKDIQVLNRKLNMIMDRLNTYVTCYSSGCVIDKQKAKLIKVRRFILRREPMRGQCHIYHRYYMSIIAPDYDIIDLNFYVNRENPERYLKIINDVEVECDESGNIIKQKKSRNEKNTFKKKNCVEK